MRQRALLSSIPHAARGTTGGMKTMAPDVTTAQPSLILTPIHDA
jgi:hypothetical protein